MVYQAMVFHWLRNRKRALLAKQPLPPGWRSRLETQFPFFTRLGARDKSRFTGMLKVFAAEKRFTGARGLRVTDEMRFVVSVLAVRMVLNLDLSYYDRVSEIILYAGDYVHPDDEAPFSGEHHEWGVVVLSWESILTGLEQPGDGFNPVIHEFAHVLDRATGSFDGTPQLQDKEQYRAWARVMSDHFERLKKLDRRELKVLDDYGAENEAEFFAVASESFFEVPALFKRELPDLYDQLVLFYRQDPAEVAKS